MTTHAGVSSGLTLAELDEDARNAAYDEIQSRMPEVWKLMRLNEPGKSAVVVPSVTVDRVVAPEPGDGRALPLPPPPASSAPAAEDLGNLDADQPLDRRVLPGVAPRSHSEPCDGQALTRGRRGLLIAPAHREAAGPTSAMGSDRIPRPRPVPIAPGAIQHDQPRTGPVDRVGYPDVRSRSPALHAGHQTGCRRSFAEAGVQHRAGFEDLRSEADVIQALAALRSQRPGIGEAMVKLNEGVSGAENAVVNLRDLAPPGDGLEATQLEQRLQQMQLETPDVTIALQVSQVLAEKGVLGRFALDFVVVRRGQTWTSYAIEVNLRKGVTTHPFLTLQFLTDGRYHPDTGLFVTPAGRERHLVATDHLEDPNLRGLRVDDLFDLVARAGIHFDHARQTGVVFHLISCLTELGRIGMTAVGESPAAARAVYDRALRVLLEEARSSIAPGPLP